jgi:bifunctional pyridoxal-dependent enzyme with beta-cystathionase and maltose regulon repressor activities
MQVHNALSDLVQQPCSKAEMTPAKLTLYSVRSWAQVRQPPGERDAQLRLRGAGEPGPHRYGLSRPVLAFKHRERIVERNRRIIGQNLEATNRFVEERSEFLSWTPPQGGLLALLRYELDVSSLELADRLSEERGVMLAPGSAFGFEHHLRIGIGQDPAVFAEGLRRVGAFLDELRGS